MIYDGFRIGRPLELRYPGTMIKSDTFSRHAKIAILIYLAWLFRVSDTSRN